MNPWALIPISALFINIFVWIYILAQQKRDPINRVFLLFSGDAVGWIAMDLTLYHPYSVGHEMDIFRLVSIFWIPCGAFFLLFAYALTGRRWDRILLLSFAVSLVGICINVFTDSIVLGYRHLFWGTAQISHPVYHPLISLGTAASGAYAVLLILRKRRRSVDALERRSLTLLSVGAVIVMAAIATTNVAMTAINPGNTFPTFGSSAFTLFVLLVFVAVTRYRFLSISLEKVAEELFEDIRDGILLTDRSGRVQRENAAAREMLDASTVGKDVRDLLGFQQMSDDFSDRELRRGIGEEARYISVSAATTEKNGEVLGRIFILRDITRQKTAEAVLLRSKEALETEVRERTEQLRRAQRMEAIGTLAGGIAHDFNNILAAILGFTVAAQNDLPQNSPVRDDLDEIIVAGKRGKEIVRQILTISRQQDTLDLIPRDVAAVLRETLDLVKVSCPDTVDLVTEIPSHLLPVRCDETQLSQVIMNITNNAIYAMRNLIHGTLTVGVEETHLDALTAASLRVSDGPAVRLYIADTGSGIASEHLEQIFNPFFTTKPQGEGTGLGLPTSLVIVQNHQGAITVDSLLGQGTTFTIFLPLLDPASLALGGETARDSDVFETTLKGQELILLVDDEPQICRMGERVLSQLGYLVQTASDGMEALCLLQASQIQYDLIISDLSMPRMSGVELAFELRELAITTPFILMSGYGEKATSEEIARAGINVFLQKPAPKTTLARTIRMLLDVDTASASLPPVSADGNTAGP